MFWQVESPRGGETIVRTGQMQDPVGCILFERLCCIDVSVSVLCFCFLVMFYCNILVNLYIPAIRTTIKLFVIPAYKIWPVDIKQENAVIRDQQARSNRYFLT